MMSWSSSLSPFLFIFNYFCLVPFFGIKGFFWYIKGFLSLYPFQLFFLSFWFFLGVLFCFIYLVCFSLWFQVALTSDVNVVRLLERAGRNLLAINREVTPQTSMSSHYFPVLFSSFPWLKMVCQKSSKLLSACQRYWCWKHEFHPVEIYRKPHMYVCVCLQIRYFQIKEAVLKKQNWECFAPEELSLLLST